MLKIDRPTNPLPLGTVTVFVGLLTAGLLTYVYLAVARRALDDASYSAFAVVWGATFIVGPGVFQPLEQALAASTARRTTQSYGTGPLLRRAGWIGLGGFLVVSLITLALWSFGLDRLLYGQLVTLAALLCSFAAYMLASVVRGALGGQRLFAPYARSLGAEGVVRLLGAMALAAAASPGAASFGFVMAGSLLVAALAGAAGTTDRLLVTGPPPVWSELSPAVGVLVVISLSEAFLLNVGPAAVAIITDDDAAPGIFLSALVIARLPLFAFQAVKVSLLPAVASYAALGEIAKLRSTVFRLLAVTAMLGAVSIAGCAIAGPFFVRFFFVDDVARTTVVLLATANALAMLVIALSVTMIGTQRAGLAACCWIAGVMSFFVFLAMPGSGAQLVAIAMVASFGVTLCAMALSLTPVWRASSE
jgi:O-antigen/teichoic acid export membrane protein